MQREQLFGGALDGYYIEVQGHPDFFIAYNNQRFNRRRDGRLYHEHCQWDDLPPLTGVIN